MRIYKTLLILEYYCCNILIFLSQNYKKRNKMKSDYQLLIIYKIKLLREQHNISQNKLANYLGISNGQMGNIESPKMSTKYTLSQIYSLCKFLGIRIEHLFLEDKDYLEGNDVIDLLIHKIIKYEGR